MPTHPTNVIPTHPSDLSATPQLQSQSQQPQSQQGGKKELVKEAMLRRADLSKRCDLDVKDVSVLMHPSIHLSYCCLRVIISFIIYPHHSLMHPSHPRALLSSHAHYPHTIVSNPLSQRTHLLVILSVRYQVDIIEAYGLRTL